MSKEMRQVEVFATKDGEVAIRQENAYEEDDVVILMPEQIPLVIRWLREAARQAGEE